MFFGKKEKKLNYSISYTVVDPFDQSKTTFKHETFSDKILSEDECLKIVEKIWSLKGHDFQPELKNVVFDLHHSEYRSTIKAARLARIAHQGQKNHLGQPIFQKLHSIVNELRTDQEIQTAWLCEIYKTGVTEHNLAHMGFKPEVVVAVDLINQNPKEVMHLIKRNYIAKTVLIQKLEYESKPELVGKGLFQRFKIFVKKDIIQNLIDAKEPL